MNKTINLFIVEDESIVAFDMEQRLNSLGHNVLGIADNAIELFDYLESEELKPDLLLLDIQIVGKLTGIDIADKIMNGYHLPVIFITANSDEDMLEAAQRTNPYGFVFKPFDTKDLKVAIEIAYSKFIYEQKLEIINNELEKRVLERTKNILEINAHLKREIELRNVIEEELMVNKNLYRDTIKYLGSGLVLVREDGTLISVNDSFINILGLPEKSLLLKNIIEIISPNDWENITKYFLVDKKELWKGELHINVKLNNKNWCKIFVSKVNPKMHSEYIVSVIDINEAKIYEKLLVEERKQNVLSLLKGEDRERQRIARELHDSLGQKLTAAKLSIGSVLLGAKLDKKNMDVLIQSKEIIEESMQEVREVSQNLLPSVLVDYGLSSALARVLDRINSTGKTKCVFKEVGAVKRLEASDELNIFRIAQEAINNSVKHSNASQIKVLLTNKANDVIVKIQDNGLGINFNSVNKGNGLENMKARALLVRAQLVIKSQLNKGTKIEIRTKHGK